MSKTTFWSASALWLAAILWGFAFVAQRKGMEDVGPFAFNAVRFAMGGLALIPFGKMVFRNTGFPPFYKTLISGFLMGIALFAGASFQQIGMVSTTAGNAGFITSLYILFVPIMSVLLGKKVGLPLWIASILAVVGAYLISFKGSDDFQSGDIWVFTSAFFWAIHVLLASKFTQKYNPIYLAIIQFFICSIFSFFTSSMVETTSLSMLENAAIPIVYGGLISVGIAYTLQLIAQRYVHPALASVILGTESVFALIGGWLVLSEEILIPGLIGCLLVFLATLVAQVKNQSTV